MYRNGSTSNAVESAPQYSLLNNNLEFRKDQKLLSNASTNECGRQNGITKLPVPSSCSKNFGNLQDYLLEMSKTLGQRQSFYSLDFADILGKVEKWRNMLPSVEMFYAVKANPDPLLLKLLVTLGISFDCATEGEIQAVLRAGASPSSILWAHTVKPVEGLLYAQRIGVDTMTFDSEEELRKIHEVFPTAKLILRIQPSVVKCRFDLSDKFGCHKSEAENLLTLAKKLQMDIQGISFHVGALCTDPESFSTTIRDCKEIFEQARHIGYHLSVLDIGGGFFGASGTEPIFDKIVIGIRQALDHHFSDSKVRLIAEPGCYVVASAVNLICTVMGKRSVKKDSGVLKCYFLNNGIYGSFFRDIESYDIRARPLLTKAELERRRPFESVLYGQTCCSEDVIQKGTRLPELEIGECILWENMGAYSIPLCGTFCGVPLPTTVYIFQHTEGSKSCDTLMNNSVRKLLEEHAVFIGSDCRS